MQLQQSLIVFSMGVEVRLTASDLREAWLASAKWRMGSDGPMPKGDL